MKIKINNLIGSLNKTFRKEQINRADFDNFKSELKELLSKVDAEENEEHLKYPFRDFLLNTFFSDNEINTKGRTDLAIYSGKTNKTPVNVIFEIKKYKSSDFPTTTNINCKAIHQAVFYYIRERYEEKNDNIKHVIITNIYEWFIFDAYDFEKIFYKNTKTPLSLIDEYKNWKSGKKVSKKTELFYKIVKRYIDNSEDEISLTYFDIRDYEKILTKNEKKAVPLFKILSATHLLKLDYITDSNSLNYQFYNELLYIIGLAEVKEGSKKVIKRASENKRINGSLIENTISTIRTENRLSKIKEPRKFGNNQEEQLLNIAIELSLTWINRILFLKLLEAQFIGFHREEKDYKFLDISIITNFDDFNELFFDILAKETHERGYFIKEELKNIPYLNSSLFEISELEDNIIRINSLKNRLTMQLYSHTVLSKKRKKIMPTLEYLFEFLNAYNFANEGTDEIMEENKSLINASVLGLIFEKINGYKEGSFFTPGYITMYMSRETIRLSIIQKFREAGYQLSENLELTESFNELITKIESKEEANKIINDIKIIDPAVGSGHFLVSALNEIIAIKSELNILCYKSGRRIFDFKAEVVNDDLIITNLDTEEIFEYVLNKKGNIIPYKQDLQEAIFNEKQIIIENCLFGVDINPNSVNICRLRLWIELLKHTFYTKKSNYSDLEILPNIDINIKHGNSLISNFGTNGNGLSNGQSRKIRLATQKYKDQVILYKSTDNKKVKKYAEKNIADIKNMFSNIARPLDKDYRLLKEKEAKLGEMSMFFTREDKEKWEIARAELQKEIEEIEEKLEYKRKTIYRDAFEWRFEFPEVLDENGNFIGFDVLIGNPPYISIKEIHKNQKEYLTLNFKTAKGQFDLYTLFIEKSIEILKNSGQFSMITSNTYFTNKNLQPIRKFLLENVKIEKLINLDESIFKEAKLDVGITIFKKQKNNSNYEINIIPNKTYFETGQNYFLQKKNFETSQNNIFTISVLPSDIKIFDKMKIKAVLLKKIANINRGIEYGSNSTEIKKRKNKNSFPIIVGHSIEKYNIKKYEGYAKFKENDKSNYKNFELYTKPRILMQRIRNLSLKIRLVAIFTETTILCTNTLRVITLNQDNFNYKYILGLLNSKLMSYFFGKNFLNKDIYAYQIGQIPIKTANKSMQNKIILIVKNIMKQKEVNKNADTSKLETQLDKIVYKLYGLSKSEISEIEKFYE